MKIMIKTNVGKSDNEYEPLKYDMLYSEIKDQVGEVDSDYPYFTASVKFPYDLLFYRDYAYVLEFFFSSKKFQKVLMKNIVDYVDENAIYGTDIAYASDLSEETIQRIATFEANTEYNVQAMMKLLFPIRFTFDNAFSSTYRQLVLGEYNANMIAFDPKNPFSEGETGMMTVGGNIYIVNNVVWVNDIVNHPIYYEFMVKYNNSIKTKRGYETKMDIVYREKIMELMILLQLLYYPKQPTAAGSPQKPDFFTELKISFENEQPQIQRNAYISNTLANKKQVLNVLLKELEFFVSLPNASTIPPPQKMVDDSNIGGKLVKSRVFEKIYENELIIADIVKHITRIYNTYYENKTDVKIMISSELNANLTKLYNACIAIKATKTVQSFVFGELRFLDMSEKNKDDTPKSKEERDVISYISKYFGSFAKMSDNIVISVNNIIPPIRETSNAKLRNEINKIRFKSSEPTDPKLGDAPSCSRSNDFFRDVYNKYVLNRGQMPVDVAIMYTGVNTSTSEYVAEQERKTASGDGNTTYEIYVIVDLINKAHYESKKNRCRLEDDVLTNELNYLLYTRMDNMLNTYRKYDNFNASFANSGATTNAAPSVKEGENSASPITKTQGGKLLSEILKNKKQYFSGPKTRKSILGARRVKNRNYKRTRRHLSKKR